MSIFLPKMSTGKSHYLQKSIFLSQRFVFAEKKEHHHGEESKAKKDDGLEKLTFDEFHNQIRDSVIATLAKNDTAREISDTDILKTFMNTGDKKSAETVILRTQKALEKIEKETNPLVPKVIQKKNEIDKLIKEIHGITGIPISILKIELYKTEIGASEDNVIDRLRTYIKKSVNITVKQYKEFQESRTKSDNKSFEKAFETPGMTDKEKMEAKREKQIREFFNEPASDAMLHFETNLKKDFDTEFINKYFENACSEFGIVDEDLKKKMKEEKKNQLIRLYSEALLNNKGISEAEAIINDPTGVTNRTAYIEFIATCKTEQQKVLENVAWLKKRNDLLTAIDRHQLNDSIQIDPNTGTPFADKKWVGALGADREKYQNYSVGSYYRELIEQCDSIHAELDKDYKALSDIPKIDKNNPLKTKQAEESEKKTSEIKSEMDKKKKLLKIYEEVIDSALSKCSEKPTESKPEEVLQQEIRETTRAQATGYLINEWLVKDPAITKMILDKGLIPRGDHKSIEAILKDPATPDKIIFDYYLAQKEYDAGLLGEKIPSNSPCSRFITEMKHLIESFFESAGFRNALLDTFLMNYYGFTKTQKDDFIKKMREGQIAPPGNIATKQCVDFYKNLFSFSNLSMDYGVDEKQKETNKGIKKLSSAAEKIILPYLGADEKKSKMKDSKGNEFGKTAQELIRKLMRIHVEGNRENTDGKRINTQERIDELIKKDWQNGLYKDIMAVDENDKKMQKELDEIDKVKGKDGKVISTPTEYFGIAGKLFGNGLSFLNAVTSNWHFMSFNMISTMFETGADYFKRRMVLYNLEKGTDVGKLLSAYIPVYGDQLIQEYTKTMQAKENEEVSNIQASYKQYGYDQLKDILKTAKNTYFLKAAFFQLVENGWLLESDILTPEARSVMKKLLGADVDTTTPIDKLTPGEKEKIITEIGNKIDAKWGRSSYVGWINNSESTRQSNIQKNAGALKLKDGPEREQLMAGWVNQLFEGGSIAKEFKGRSDPSQLLGPIYGEQDTGWVDTNVHMTTMLILRMEGVIEDQHITALQNTYFNHYPAFAIFTKDKAHWSGLEEVYDKLKKEGKDKFITETSPGVFKFNENNPLYRFFGGEDKLPLYAYETESGRWIVASTEAERNRPDTKLVYLNGRDVQRGRRIPNFKDFPDNSNIRLYTRYTFSDLTKNLLRRNTSGAIDRLSKSQDLCSFYGGMTDEIAASTVAFRDMSNEMAKGEDGLYKGKSEKEKEEIFNIAIREIKTIVESSYMIAQYLLEVVGRDCLVRDRTSKSKIKATKTPSGSAVPGQSSNWSMVLDDETGRCTGKASQTYKYLDRVLSGSEHERTIKKSIMKMMGMELDKNLGTKDKTCSFFQPVYGYNDLIDNMNVFIKEMAGVANIKTFKQLDEGDLSMAS